MSEIDSLKEELLRVSESIYLVKERLAAAKEAVETIRLQRELKQLQYQALFYIEKIDNLKWQTIKE